MSKKKTKVENPEIEQPKIEQPGYVQELLEKGVVVLKGRSVGELNDMLDNIPSDVNFYTGQMDHYLGSGLYRIQVNIKEN